MAIAQQTVSIVEELTDFLATAPSQEEILAFKPSDALQARVSELLETNRRVRLTDDETKELEEILRYGHLINLLKAKIRLHQSHL